MKIQRAAAKAGQDVRGFCDESYKPFQKLAREANVDWDHFIRTSEPDHRFAVQHFWSMLRERGWIYAKKHEGWYSVSDETFYPEKGVHLALDRATGRKFMASKETGSEVEWTAEKNYHFRMSALTERLLAMYQGNPQFVIPGTRMRDVIQEVSAGLQDLSISRPSDRLSWGIPVPDDESQTIYVWLDALINYLTKANYPFQIPGMENADGWPADIHVIGKDIVRFHCIYWPAFLLALDLPLPKQILTHAHWTLGRKKMSKSTGNVVNPFFAIHRFGVDCMRYYLALDGGIKDDAMYDNSFIIRRYNTGLKNGLGNLVSRVLRAKRWNISRTVHRSSVSDDLYDQDFKEELQILPRKVAAMMEVPDPGGALGLILEAIQDTNSYIQSRTPWDLTEPADEEKLDSVVFLCLESIRISGILLQPFMPDKMKELLDMLGVADDARLFSNASFGSDSTYGQPWDKIPEEPLFPPLTSRY